MDRLSDELLNMFDEMMTCLTRFRKNSYEKAFLELQEKYEALANEFIESYSEADDQEAFAKEMAGLVAEHAHLKMENASKRQQEIQAIDLNLTMAVYFIPLIRYNRAKEGDELAEYLVKSWNELPVTPMTLQISTYDDVKGGFKTKLCYITTAVCDYQGKSDNCYELTTLRSYRDHYLMNTEEGRALVQEYYAIAPRLVMTLKMLPDASNIYDFLYKDYLMPCIRLIEEGSEEACKALYIDMVRGLEKRYISC